MLNDFDEIQRKVKNELADYEFRLGFTPESALAAAHLIFAKNDFFKWCTEESRTKCLLDTLVFGLNPLKNQCYYVPFKDRKKDISILTFMMDYSGAVIVAKDVNQDIKDIRSKLVREGDQFEFEIKNGLYVINRHNPTLDSLNGEGIAAYAVAVDQNDKPIELEIMTKDQYVMHVRKTSKPINGKPVVNSDGTFIKESNHYKHPEKMFLKTVIHALCRGIIKTSPNEKIQSANNRMIDYDDDVNVSESQQQPEVIDFDKPRQEPQATPEQADKIVEIAKQIGELDYMLIDVSSFVQRDIKKLRELTELEANRYIEMKLKSIVQQPPPDEPASDETPPWK